MSATPSSTPRRGSRTLGRLAVLVVGAGLLVGVLAGAASAKEVTSGGTPTPVPTACNPVTSLTYKGDATTADTGAASIQLSYGVKPCTNGQAVRLDVQLYRNAPGGEVVYDNPNAALSGKVMIFGITANTSYIAKVTVFDATTGANVGSQQIYAAAVFKRV